MQTTTNDDPASREAAISAADPPTLSLLYQDTRERILGVVGAVDVSTAVAACPGWSVRDVMAHLAAVAEDWVSGRLSGPPTDRDTAAQIARFNGCDMESIVAAWNSASVTPDTLAKTDELEPPLGDVVAHEHDIRGATDRPGARDCAEVTYSSDQLLTALRTPVPVRVTVEDAEYHCGPGDGPEILLRTTRFEALRWRTGRRSRTQLAAMDWSSDPAPVLDHLYLFGPAVVDLVE